LVAPSAPRGNRAPQLAAVHAAALLPLAPLLARLLLRRRRCRRYYIFRRNALALRAEDPATVLLPPHGAADALVLRDPPTREAAVADRARRAAVANDGRSKAAAAASTGRAAAKTRAKVIAAAPAALATAVTVLTAAPLHRGVLH